MIKTAVENNQNLIVEGCYIPFDWAEDFSEEYLAHIKYYCLIISENYIRAHFDDIKNFANVIENRLEDDCTIESVLNDNLHILEAVKRYAVNYVLIEDEYQFEIEL